MKKAKRSSLTERFVYSRTYMVCLLLFVTACGVLSVYFVVKSQSEEPSTSASQGICAKSDYDSTARSRYHTVVGRERCVLWLERADTPAAREKGLSGRKDMSAENGMLFVFDSVGQQCMWMKDMHFAIDMLWLDEAGTILKVEKNVKPETYPATFCGDNAKMVVEVKAGVANLDWLQVGKRI